MFHIYMNQSPTIDQQGNISFCSANSCTLEPRWCGIYYHASCYSSFGCSNQGKHCLNYPLLLQTWRWLSLRLRVSEREYTYIYDQLNCVRCVRDTHNKFLRQGRRDWIRLLLFYIGAYYSDCEVCFALPTSYSFNEQHKCHLMIPWMVMVALLMLINAVSLVYNLMSEGLSKLVTGFLLIWITTGLINVSVF